MPTLKPDPTLADYQQYVIELEEERGFSDQTVLMKTLMLGEELGELFKAIRKQQAIKIDHTTAKVGGIDEELVDMFIFLCSIANRYEIDLEEAFRQKEAINENRVWE
ncbi:MAG: MazG nucleotide pyrophosphohydrolase domain-containing protein [Anaerolineae bacterium]|jgi:NTP pyrophosphatase (non-canonical NTP hydrolase)|nr:MazG nucleotide pyrophosphohydrolase domain-containing protein [Anaerolineae bacterium]